MRKRIGAFGLIASLAVTVVALPSSSRAAIVETIIDPDTDATLGSITFPDLAGDGAAGLEFSLDGFTQADITSVSWTLDSSDYAIASLDLQTLQGDANCGPGMNCSNTALSLSQHAFSKSGITCSFNGETGLCGISLSSPTAVSFVLTSVPEPSTWAMMLVGLGFAGWRAQRKGPRHSPRRRQ